MKTQKLNFEPGHLSRTARSIVRTRTARQRMDIIKECWIRIRLLGRTLRGPFEREVAARVGSKHAVATATGTAALHVACWWRVSHR